MNNTFELNLPETNEERCLVEEVKGRTVFWLNHEGSLDSTVLHEDVLEAPRVRADDVHIRVTRWPDGTIALVVVSSRGDDDD